MPADLGEPSGILVIEDDAFVATWIAELLAEAGFLVVGTAASATEAISYAAASRPRIALVDIKLAGPLDGIELACLLRDKHSVPTIFLSGLVDTETTERAEVARPVGFLAKPFRPAAVFNALEQALAS